ncbi:MAG: PilZ domain-containing protein [Bdellovibrio sp.]|nr:PilZ domain-containing protein [Bdellovibrio sp.]
MITQVFLTGIQKIPAQFKDEKAFNCALVENPYALRGTLGDNNGEKILVVFLPFLETRHYDMYSYLQRTTKNLKTFFVVNELSSSMRVKLKNHKDFIVLWKSEEAHLRQDILAYLEGKHLELRQDKRENIAQNTMLSPSLLPLGSENKNFQPIMGGQFENISLNGSCLKVKTKFYSKKDFVNLTYQNPQGEYISIEGQVRWARWNEIEENQELGVQFLTQG